MTYFGSDHNLLRRGDFGQWTSAAREDGDSAPAACRSAKKKEEGD